MKLFSRKALVAAATTAAVSLSGVTVATAETTNDDTTVANDTNTTNEGENVTEGGDPTDGGQDGADEESSSSSSSDDSEGSSISDMDPSKIRDWIAVFTAIISALGTVIAFYNKNFAK